MPRIRSHLLSRPFFVISASSELVESIFIIQDVEGQFVPYIQKIPGTAWVALFDFKSQTARQAFDKMVTYFAEKKERGIIINKGCAIHTRPKSMEPKKVRDVAWQKFRSAHIPDPVLDMIHLALDMTQFERKSEGWYSRMEIGMMYILHPCINDRLLAHKWEKAFWAWFPDQQRRIQVNSRKCQGFGGTNEAWENLVIRLTDFRKIYALAKKLSNIRKKLDEELDLSEKSLIAKTLSGWRAHVGALYLLNPISRSNGDLLLDKWENSFYTQLSA